ncbi:hypothetical protein CSW60_12050 [Caulobacter sp. X]|nr:hypothetical protein CSW60_12050 [Caulobacter sp. X]
MMIGSWVQRGEICEGDSGVTYRADGSYGAYDISGEWTLSGNRLLTTVTERGEPLEPSVRVDPPERYESTVLSAAPDNRKERWSDGSLHEYRRCPDAP